MPVDGFLGRAMTSSAMNYFFQRVRTEFPQAEPLMRGYDQAELRKLEELYDIVIDGELASFLVKAGRSDGGVIGDDPVVLYRSAWSVRAHILFQLGLIESLQDAGAWVHVKKPFVVSLESETQYYFLRTGATDGSRVFRFDGNVGSVSDTGMSLAGYLLDVMNRYELAGVVCAGEMLRI